MSDAVVGPEDDAHQISGAGHHGRGVGAAEGADLRGCAYKIIDIFVISQLASASAPPPPPEEDDNPAGAASVLLS